MPVARRPRENSGAVDPLPVPQLEEVARRSIVAERREIADLRPLPRRRDRGVRRVAAEARQIEPLAATLDLGELHQRLAEGEEVEVFMGGAKGGGDERA